MITNKLTKYRRKDGMNVIAVQFNFTNQGFSYEKWGGIQKCKPGDWIVENQGETYTIDKDSFAETYRKVSDGVYAKTACVYAEVATVDGSIPTKEGLSAYNAGDILVYNKQEKLDGYTIKPDKFNSLYELDT